MNRENHPVWTVYDSLRTMRLNAKYYGCRVQTLERCNRGMEFLIAVAAPSSAVAGWSFWKYGIGASAWQILGGIAALAAIVKPTLNLTKDIKVMEGLVSEYCVLDAELMEIKAAIQQKGHFDASSQAQYRRIMERMRPLVGRSPEKRPKRRVLRKCRQEVDQELPAENFFVPEKDNDD